MPLGMLRKLKSSIQLLEKVVTTSFGRLQQQQLHWDQVTSWVLPGSFQRKGLFHELPL